MTTADDIEGLPLPPEVLDALRKPRDVRVAQHGIPVRAAWWNMELGRFHLPGGRLQAEYLTRQDVWSLAAGAADADGAFRLLWHTLAWGAGNKLRQNRKRLAAISTDVDGTGNGLVAAARLAGEDPVGAYRVLRPGRANLIKSLGPNFFTKYLYFAGGGAPEHPALILDSRVAGALHDRCGWRSLHTLGPWTPEIYGRYSGLIASWASEAASHRNRPVGNDEIERCLFELGPKPNQAQRRPKDSSLSPSCTGARRQALE